MDRTTIQLPKELHEAAKLRAFEEGISLAELIRQSLQERLEK